MILAQSYCHSYLSCTQDGWSPYGFAYSAPESLYSSSPLAVWSPSVRTCLSVWSGLLVCVSVFLFVSLPVCYCLSVCLPFCLSLGPSFSWFHRPVCACLCLSLPVCQSLCPSLSDIATSRVDNADAEDNTDNNRLFRVDRFWPLADSLSSFLDRKP